MRNNFLETFILYLALTLFAIYGVTQLAPAVGRALSEHLKTAAEAGDRKPTL